MTIDINEFDENWQKVAGQKFTMHKSFFNPHDFAVSKNYYVFFQNAMSFKMVSLFPENTATCMRSHCSVVTLGCHDSRLLIYFQILAVDIIQALDMFICAWSVHG